MKNESYSFLDHVDASSFEENLMSKERLHSHLNQYNFSSNVTTKLPSITSLRKDAVMLLIDNSLEDWKDNTF